MTKTPAPKALLDKIHLTNAALDEIATSRGQQIVLRGVIDPASLPLLKIDEYQREALPLSALARGRSTNRLINRKDQEAAKAPKRFASFEVRNKSELEYPR